MTIVLIFQKTTKTSSRSIEEKKRVVVFVFLGLPQMQCAGVICFAMRRRGCLNPLCTFPGGHWIRANIRCGHRKVGCLFKQEPSEGARWPPWKRGRNPTTRHRNIDSQLHIMIYRHPAKIASFWSEGLPGPTDQLYMLQDY